MVGLSRHAERLRQVEGADEDDVELRHRRDGLKILQRQGAFAVSDAEGVLVGVPRERGRVVEAVAGRAVAGRETALAQRGVLDALDERRGLFWGVDLRDLHAERARVQRLEHLGRPVFADADDRHASLQFRRPDELGQRFGVHRHVFVVEYEEVEAAEAEHLGGARVGELDKGSQHRFATPERGLDRVIPHRPPPSGVRS
jgi:hypothetical protein